MSELAEFAKVDLIQLGKEFDVELVDTDGTRAIIKKIERSEEYDKKTALAQLRLIKEERESQEKERVRKFELEEKERESQEKEKERQFELEKLKLQCEQETMSLSSNHSRDRKKNVPNLKNVLPVFDPENSEMVLYLNLFERQLRILEVEESEWTSHLLTLLPTKLAEQIIKLPEDTLADYEKIKKTLLERYKMNAETLRTKFVSYQRPQGTLWKDVIYDLETYLDGWLEQLEVTDFKSLKRLMISDQMKRRAAPDIKERFLDEWSGMKEPREIATKFDNYEAVRKVTKKPFVSGRPDEKREKTKVFEKGYGTKNPPEQVHNWRTKDARSKEEEFEKKRVLRCYECSSPDHLRPSCPRLCLTEVNRVSHLMSGDDAELYFQPYVTKGKINGVENDILRDTGANYDLVPHKLINAKHLTGEKVWVKSPLSENSFCFPVAVVQLELPNSCQIETKAAVLPPDSRMKQYLLGNRTHCLLEKEKSKPKKINKVVTRSQLALNNPPSPSLQKEKINRQVQCVERRESEGWRHNPSTKDESLLSEREDFVKKPRGDEMQKYCGKKGAREIKEGNLKESCSPQQLVELETVLNKQRRILSNDPGRTDLVEHLDEILRKITDAKCKMKPSQCKLAQDSVKEIDYNVGSGEKTPAEAKIQAVLDFRAPQTKNGLRKILEKIGECAKNIKNYACLVEPLTRALKRKTRKKKVKWTPEMDRALEGIKRRLMQKPFNCTTVHKPGKQIAHVDCLSRL